MGNKSKNEHLVHMHEAAIEVVNRDKIREEAKLALGKESDARQLANIEAVTKIRLKDADEAQARFLRVLFLRQHKELLKKDGEWAAFCREGNIDLKNADYEISKFGDLKDELLLKFGVAVGFEINKIKYLTGSDSKKLGVEIKEETLYYKGDKVPTSEFSALIMSVQDELQKEREERERDKRSQRNNLADREKTILKLRNDIDRYTGEANAKDMSPEEDAFLSFMDMHQRRFDGLILTVQPERCPALSSYGKRDETGAKLPSTVTIRMRSRYLQFWDYLLNQVTAYQNTAEETFLGGDMMNKNETPEWMSKEWHQRNKV